MMTLQSIEYPSASPADSPSPLVDFWVDVMGPKFMKFRHILVDGLLPHSAAVLPDVPILPGAHVLDVGCGFGDTALVFGKRVGDKGKVLGVDCVPSFIDFARREAREAGADNVRFACRDAEISLPQGVFDHVFARFGTMFFANPVAGLRNMRRALKPDGHITHIVWRAREDNPWLAAARGVLLTHLPAPDAGAPSCGPGPFSMADQDVTRGQMEAAGFADISFQRVDAKVLVGRDVDDAIAFQLALGPAGEIFRAAGAQAERKREVIVDDLRELFGALPLRDGGIWMDSSSWVVRGSVASA